MSVTLKRLFRENNNSFKLSLLAGEGGINNVVSWVYMLEDEDITSYFHGSELAVTTCMKSKIDTGWLCALVTHLNAHDAAGLIINTGKFITEIPDDVIEYCNAHDFPILTMPWEIKITDMLQSFCIQIMNNQHESLIHDQAMRDAILKRENVDEYRNTLARYYDISGMFTIFCIYLKQIEDVGDMYSNTENLLETRLRRLKMKVSMPGARIGIVSHENYFLIILNNVPSPLLPRISQLIVEVYAEAAKKNCIFIGVGTEVEGLENIDKSYQRAVTAMRMAMFRRTPLIQFEDMGIYKILFSVRDLELLYAYADEILAPLDRYDEKGHQSIELLKTYIHEDRSLAGTAEALFMHRNTVNYQIQKMKELLGSPLKTVEDLFPYQVALAIRDMEKNAEQS